MRGTTIFIILIITFFVIRTLLKFNKFKGELNADNEEFKNQNFEDKFRILIDGLNECCYQGLGKIIKIDKKTFFNIKYKIIKYE